MSIADESSAAKTPLGSDLAAGVEAISLNQTIQFTLYKRLVLPLDGYVFWVRASLYGPSALPDKALIGRVGPNQPPSVSSAARTFVAKGSLHYSTDTRQEESENYAANRVVFTAEELVNPLNETAPNTLWIGEWEGLRFAFSSRGPYYRQADLHHYVGFAVYSDMATQIIDDPSGFDSRNVVVSNSLPAWLALNGYNPGYGFGNPSLVLYPSFLTPSNLEPPYAAVHIPPEATRTLAMAPRIDSRTSTHSQLCADLVRITLWGTRNFSALDFVDCVNQYSSDFGAIGMMNSPVVRDEKRTQTELGTLAMKKTVEFEVSYLQSRINDVAMQAIQRATAAFSVGDAAA